MAVTGSEARSYEPTCRIALLYKSRFLNECHFLSDGFVAGRLDDCWRLGGVLLASWRDQICLVQKAERSDEPYEYSGMWVLPGGMVRADHFTEITDNIDDSAVRQSLQYRTLIEAGLEPSHCSDWQPLDRIGPVITSYRAKGRQRFTLVMAHTCAAQSQTIGPAQLPPSISEVAWIDARNLSWEFLAPANRIILAHLLWDIVSPDLTKADRGFIDSAVKICAEWNVLCGFGAVPAPWASSDELANWREGWQHLGSRGP